MKRFIEATCDNGWNWPNGSGVATQDTQRTAILRILTQKLLTTAFTQ